MTLVLVVACLAVAGAELYLAFGRSRRDATTLTKLEERNSELESRLAEALTRLDALAADLSTRPDTTAITRLTRKLDSTVEELGTRLDGARRTQEEFAERHDTTADDFRRTQDALAARLDAAAYDLRHVEDTLGDRLSQLDEHDRALATRLHHLEHDKTTAEHLDVLDRNDAALATRLHHAEHEGAAAADRLDALAEALETGQAKIMERLVQLDQNDARLAGRVQRVELDSTALLARVDAVDGTDRHARVEELGRENAELTERLRRIELDGMRVATRVDGLGVAEVASRVEELSRESFELTARLRQIEREGAEITARIDELAEDEAGRTELLDLRTRTDQALERLEELDAERDRDLERYRDLAQALDTVEDLLAGQRAETEPTTVKGGLSGDTADVHEILTKTYDDFVDTMDLRVRMQVPSGSSPWQTQYYLAGKNPARLRRDFASLLNSLHTGATDPRTESLHRLATAMTQADQAYAQIGPLALIRLGDTLLCGVLTVAENRRFDVDRYLSDPSATAARLRLLPDTRFRDLTTWPQTA
ncbi:hypothetical protein [Actinocorallia longicatena]|uniref:Uncharacterized protein n=1 Tax=Actinocorallia longicatena TaxID=111803 RepID=A0ABP6QMI7_9ACTN